MLEPSRRRGALVGVLREEPGGGLLFLLPADPRLPRCFVRPADLPPALKRELKARGRCCRNGGGHGAMWSCKSSFFAEVLDL